MNYIRQVTVHPAEDSPWLTSSRAYSEMTTRYQRPGNRSAGGTVKSQYMNIKLAPKEFVRIDHPRQPCRSGANGGGPDCEIECFQRAVTSVTNCRFSSIILFWEDFWDSKCLAGFFSRFPKASVHELDIGRDSLLQFQRQRQTDGGISRPAHYRNS